MGDRTQTAFLFWHEAEGQRRVLVLDRPRVTVGRAPGSDVLLASDERVSRVHAKFDLTGLPPRQKRTRLAELAFRAGVVSRRDLL